MHRQVQQCIITHMCAQTNAAAVTHTKRRSVQQPTWLASRCPFASASCRLSSDSSAPAPVICRSASANARRNPTASDAADSAPAALLRVALSSASAMSSCRRVSASDSCSVVRRSCCSDTLSCEHGHQQQHSIGQPAAPQAFLPLFWQFFSTAVTKLHTHPYSRQRTIRQLQPTCSSYMLSSFLALHSLPHIALSEKSTATPFITSSNLTYNVPCDASGAVLPLPSSRGVGGCWVDDSEAIA
jgi:hypothetical protein